ncbi:type II toxin-antitoxin system HicB family antitoxin [candidate division KSB1 bacterium]|nr:type II toxin-antitoxin system HicB family antitoxin [candidate division KSB1 bacterium]
MMEYKSRLAHVDFDSAAAIFHGEVSNTRDVITFQARSVDEFKKAFEDSMEDDLAFCAEQGETPDEPFNGRVAVRLSPDQHKQVVLATERVGKNIASCIAAALLQAAY